MHPQKREMYVLFIVTLENVESCIYAKKKISIFMYKSIQLSFGVILNYWTGMHIHKYTK